MSIEITGNISLEPSEQTLPDKAAIIWAARMLGDTWLLLIIRELLEGTRRFREIQDGLGKINPQTLSGRLKQLEQCGLSTRQAFAEIPPRVEYSLTEKGYAVSAIVKALGNFGQQYMEQDKACLAGECPPQN